MKSLKYINILLAIFGLTVFSTLSAQNVLTANGSMQPAQTTYSGGTVITIPYSMSFKMLTGQQKKITIQFNAANFDFLTTDLPAASNNLFQTVAAPAGQAVFETSAFTAADNNFNYAVDFTISFRVKAATCIKLNDNITIDLKTTNCGGCNGDIKSVTTPVSFLNSNSGPTVAIDLLMGYECSLAMYKITTFGLDVNSTIQNSTINLILPTGATLIDLYNSAGTQLTLPTSTIVPGGKTYSWQRSGVSAENVQYHYVVVKFNKAILCTGNNSIYQFSTDFSSFNTCNSSPANAATAIRQITLCCGTGGGTPSPPNVTNINGVILSKFLIKNPLRYFPQPDNCKTHDYIIQIDNVTGNTLTNFKLEDFLSGITSASDEIEVTGISASFSSAIASQSFSFTTTPASTPAIAALTNGQSIAITGSSAIGANPVQDISIDGVSSFPAYSSLIIKISHKLVNPNTGNFSYINKAGLSFDVSGTPYSGSVVFTSKKDNYDPLLAITKKVRNVTDNNPAGSTSYTNAVNASPSDLLEFEIRIRNYGMKDVQANFSDNISEFPALSNFSQIIPTSLSVTDGTGLGTYSATDLNAIKNSIAGNLSSSGFFCTIQDVKAAPCNGYSEIVIRYKVNVKPAVNVKCESIYTNGAKLGWMLNGVSKSDYKEAIVNIDLFKNIMYKLEATCKDPAIATASDWVAGNINGIPGKPIWYRATVRNNTSNNVDMQVMIQLPNATDNSSSHNTSTAVNNLASFVPTVPPNAPTPELYPVYPIPTGWWPANVVSSNTATDGFLSQCTAPTPDFFGRTAIYQTVSLLANTSTSFTYQVIVPSNIMGSQYVTAMGVSRSCSNTNSCALIRATNLTLTIGQCNECGCASGCDLITLDSKIERTPLGGNNFKISLNNIISNGNNINNFDIVVHQPYRDVVLGSPAPYNKAMLPYTLGSISSGYAPPFVVTQPTVGAGQRFYNVLNISSPVSFGDVSFNVKVTLPPVVDNLIFPVNIVFRDKKDQCNICEKTIYLKYESWNDLVQKNMLTDDDDPIDIQLDADRKRLQKSKLGPGIEKWYADIKKNDAISNMVEKHPTEITQLLKVARRLIEQGSILTQKDYDLIEKGMRMVDKEAAPAPEGLIDESLKRLKLSIGKKWEGVMENLIK